MKRALIAFALLLAVVPASGQLFSQGSDPGYLKWYSVETPYYKVIYPEGADSLAYNYGRLLERYRVTIGRSIGMAPGQYQWLKKTPVVLHTRDDYSNGSMFWAPGRMDLFTRMEPYGSDPNPWDVQLAAHEPRHQAQLQLGYRGWWRSLNWVVGELWPSACWALYPSQALSEGDAVAVETAISGASRTRTADFLNYFHVAFDEGDWRNWARWRYGSWNKITPDYYKVGYMTVAGMRYFYDRPLFMADYFDGIVKRPLTVGNMQKNARRVSGKRFKETFGDIMKGFNDIWQEEAGARAPFMAMEPVSLPGRFPADYESPLVLDGKVYALLRRYDRPRELVFIDTDGSPHPVRPWSGNTSKMFHDPVKGRIYWSETVSDPRWDLAGTSRIRFMEPGLWKAVDLTAKGRYYNPAPSPDGGLLAVVEYPFNGGAALVVMDSGNGSVLRRVIAPDGLQPTEPAWIGEDIYVSAIADGGYGIYKIGLTGLWEEVFTPSVQKIVNLYSDGRTLFFISDRDGENELYSYTPASRNLIRRSSTRYGINGYCFDGEKLYLTSQTSSGKQLFVSTDLPAAEVSFAPTARHPVEDAITAQELVLGPLEDTAAVVFSDPKPYRKALHLFKIHSWAPVYFDYDEIQSMSFDLSYLEGFLGATALFQNDLGTCWGSFGYQPHRDYYDESRWRHSLHGKIVYKGLYPVIEASFSFNDGPALQYGRKEYVLPDGGFKAVTTGHPQSLPALGGSITAYIPWAWSKGGVHSGFIPKVSVYLGNEWFNTGAALMKYSGKDFPGLAGFTGYRDGRQVLYSSMSASIRGYLVLSTAKCAVYPRLGIGAEAGAGLSPGLEGTFSPSAYEYMYMYLPGFLQEHGLRLTAICQQQLNPLAVSPSARVTVAPRGFPSGFTSTLVSEGGTQFKVTADYAIPFTFGDISLFSPAFYITHFIATPHFDAAFSPVGNLWSAGLDLTAETAQIAWFPFPGSVGVSYSRLGGDPGLCASLKKRNALSMIFSLDF